MKKISEKIANMVYFLYLCMESENIEESECKKLGISKKEDLKDSILPTKDLPPL
ncbi:MAG: hypothetical protein Q4E26_04305 [Prevotellaceae bacterium]|nr:hypothetical protein [Prevotellaceae bacterium]